MNYVKLREIESKRGFEDINAIREEARDNDIHSFFDEWIVTDLLGRGSFGNVYKVVKPQIGVKIQECALKVCMLRSPDEAEARIQEIETQQMLSGHPNTVQIEDYALITREYPKNSYMLIRMELLDKLSENGLSERDTIQLGIDICSVLEECSKQPQKLVHCDIKPANILVTKDKRYKLGDFGTAKTLQATMTYTGNRGTPLYMAPEVSAYGTGYDCRCDIYSLGYTMLTMLNGGTHPYQNMDRDQKAAENCLKGKYPKVKGVSAALNKIIKKMCENSPSMRYQRASEVKRDLQILVRKQKEAEEKARIEAERQAEIAKQKAKAERAKNLKLADNAVAKAEYDLKLAQSELESAAQDGKHKAEKKVAAMQLKVERAVKVQQYVAGGATFEDACRRIKEEEIAAKKKAKKGQKKGLAFAIVAIFAAVLCVGLVSFIGNEETEAKTINNYGIGSDTDIKKLVPIVFSTDVVTTSEGLLITATEDKQGYTVIGYEGTETNLTIPSSYDGAPIIEIGNRAFFDSRIESVIIPYGVRKIGVHAFAYSDNLVSVDIPDSVTVIEGRAFLKCEALKEIVIPNSVTHIGGYVFDRCRALSSVTLSQELISIGDMAFSCCSSLEEIVIPESVVSIGKRAFGGYSNGERVSSYINVQVTVHAYNEPEYYKYTLNNGVIWQLNEIYKDYVLRLKDTGYVLVKYNGNAKEVSIPETFNRKPIFEIGDNAFLNCDSVEKVIISNNVKVIKSFVFRNCDNLTEIVIPSSVTEIGAYVFLECKRNITVYGDKGSEAEKYVTGRKGFTFKEK